MCHHDQGVANLLVPVSGSFTGRGADLIIIDDPLKADEAQSELGRRTVNEWFATALISRLNDKRRGAIVLVMQRLHEDDLAGTLLKVGGWDHLDLPAIAEVDEDIPIGPKALHARKKGDVLHPQREPIEALEAIKREMGSLRFSAPVPAEAGADRRQPDPTRVGALVRGGAGQYLADGAKLGCGKHHLGRVRLVRLHHVAD